jgi:hypothetical protein
MLILGPVTQRYRLNFMPVRTVALLITPYRGSRPGHALLGWRARIHNAAPPRYRGSQHWFSGASLALTRRRTPVERDRERHEDQDYAHAPGEGQPAGSAHGLVEEEAAHRVDYLRDGLVVGEGLESAGHAVGPHEGAAGEGQREEPDESGLLPPPRRCAP